MIKIIEGEKISFASRLKELMKEKQMTQEMLSEEFEKYDLKIHNNAISGWVTPNAENRTTLKRNKQKVLLALSQIFDVDVGYLECTQVEKKEKKMTRKKRSKKSEQSEMSKKWSSKISPNELKIVKDAIVRQRLLNNSLRALNGVGIKIDPEDLEYYPVENSFQTIQNDQIITIVQIDDKYCSSSESWSVHLPDGTDMICSSDEIINIYDSMRNHVIELLQTQKKDPH